MFIMGKFQSQIPPGKSKGCFKKTSKMTKTVKANKDNTKSNDHYYHFGMVGHSKENCKAYIYFISFMGIGYQIWISYLYKYAETKQKQITAKRERSRHVR